MYKNGVSQSGLWLSLSAEFLLSPAHRSLFCAFRSPCVSLLGPASLVWPRWRLAAAGPQASWRGRSGSVARQRALVPEVATGSALPFPPPERCEESCSPGVRGRSPCPAKPELSEPMGRSARERGGRRHCV
ncbi:hypothetical protein MRX96_009733 [Rhipicephalus microplus]